MNLFPWIDVWIIIRDPCLDSLVDFYEFFSTDEYPDYNTELMLGLSSGPVLGWPGDCLVAFILVSTFSFIQRF